MPWLIVLVLVVPLAVGVLLVKRMRHRSLLDQALGLVLPVAIVLPVLALFTVWLLTPFDHWNSARLAPAVAMKYGYPLYCGREAGPILPTIYPPATYYAYAPACLASTPTAALLIAGALNTVYLGLPVVLLLLAPCGRGPGAKVLALLGFCLFLASAAAVAPVRTYFATIHADAPALGLTALSCFCLYVYRPGRHWACLASSALLITLAVWTKQTFVPAIPALCTYVWLAYGIRALGRYLLLLAAIGCSLSAIFLAAVDMGDMFFHIFQIPARHPWKFADRGRVAGLMLAGIHFLKATPLILLPMGPLVVLRLTLGSRWQKRTIQEWMNDNRWALLVIVGLFLIPTSLLGWIKVGGYHNSFYSVFFWLCASVVFASSTAQQVREKTRRKKVLGQTAVATLLIATVTLLPFSLELSASLPDVVRALHGNPQRLAFRLALKKPGAVYFPWNPLSTLMAEGRLYHHDYAVYDWIQADYPLTQERFRADIPPQVEWIAFPPAVQDRFALKFLPEFSQPVASEDLPHWELFARPSPFPPINSEDVNREEKIAKK